MPKCPNCNKEVYFAEKVTSLGKDWHRPCLKCEKCGKTLSSGSHAEQSLFTLQVNMAASPTVTNLVMQLFLALVVSAMVEQNLTNTEVAL
ncbi:Cysteine-rich protein 1 [Exaiptasia diaphana]|nr:Cysteine-rich protein 1 [Exaiptasia diaphana]